MTHGPIVSRWNELFIYDETSSSCLRRRVSTANCVKAGDVAGTLNDRGYYQVSVYGRRVKAHRIVFEMLVGAIPAGIEIDHIDRDPGNNRIDNLRLVTHLQNMRNTRRNTPHVGVCRHRNGWAVQVSFADGIARKYFSDHALAIKQARVWHRLADSHPGATVAMAKVMAKALKNETDR